MAEDHFLSNWKPSDAFPPASLEPEEGLSALPSSSTSPTQSVSLSGRLAQSMARRWREGEKPLAEDYLAQHPELLDQAEAVIDLVYGEICLRQEQGEEGASALVLARFPQWRAQL